MNIAKKAGIGLLLTAVALSLGLTASVAWAQPRTLSAGIGVEGREAHPEYALKLVFASQQGPYVADVDVEIYDNQGNKVVSTHSDGPWLFVALEPGDYRVRAMLPDGKATGADFSVGMDGQTTVNLSWPMS